MTVAGVSFRDPCHEWCYGYGTGISQRREFAADPGDWVLQSAHKLLIVP